MTAVWTYLEGWSNAARDVAERRCWPCGSMAVFGLLVHADRMEAEYPGVPYVRGLIDAYEAALNIDHHA